MIIIDGYNLLYAIYKIEDDSAFINDIGLCRLIDDYLKLTAQNGEIIFDGTGPRDKIPYESFHNLEVFFAGAGKDADTIIEEKISVNTAPKRLTIVSSDRRLRKAAHARKAIALKCEVFWAEMQRELSRKRPVPEPRAKRNGLTEKETEHWLDFFGID